MINYDELIKYVRQHSDLSDMAIAKLYIKNHQIENIKIDTIRRKITFLREFLNASTHTSPEALVLLISDVHIGRLTFDYMGNKDYCLDKVKERFDKLYNGLQKIYTILSKSYILDELYIIFLGDIIDGELTYANQQMHIEVPEYHQIVYGADIIIDFVKKCTSLIPNVEVRGVYGNHASDKRKHELNRGDIFLYKLLQERLQNNSQINMLFSEYEYDIVTIKNHNFLLYHGDGIRSYTNMPHVSIQRWGLNRLVTLSKQWEYLLLGHFHRIDDFTCSGFRCYVNGTMLTNDMYSIRLYGIDGVQKYWLFAVHKERGITFKYEIDLI